MFKTRKPKQNLATLVAAPTFRSLIHSPMMIDEGQWAVSVYPKAWE